MRKIRSRGTQPQLSSPGWWLKLVNRVEAHLKIFFEKMKRRMQANLPSVTNCVRVPSSLRSALNGKYCGCPPLKSAMKLLVIWCYRKILAWSFGGQCAPAWPWQNLYSHKCKSISFQNSSWWRPNGTKCLEPLGIGSFLNWQIIKLAKNYLFSS